MKNLIGKFLTICILSTSSQIVATQTSIFWTNCTTEVQEAETLRLDWNDYFCLTHPHKKNSRFPTDVGLTYGLFSHEGLSAEIGADFLAGKSYPFTFNGKIAVAEGAMGPDTPSMSIGLFNVGTKIGKTNQNIFDLVIGKSLPESIGGTVYIGGYRGYKSIGPVQTGIMAAFKYGFNRVNTQTESYDKLVFLVDYASGKNAIGGCGVALSYFFTKNVNIIMGPTWFSDKKINGNWKWSIQFNATLF